MAQSKCRVEISYPKGQWYRHKADAEEHRDAMRAQGRRTTLRRYNWGKGRFSKKGDPGWMLMWGPKGQKRGRLVR